jgi:hypothetical protein
VERNRAGTLRDQACDAVVSENGAWDGLHAALSDADLTAAFASPERMPPLVLDAGYFRCTHAGVQIAVSDIGSDMSRPEDKAPRETAALRRLSRAAEGLLAETLALPACASLR